MMQVQLRPGLPDGKWAYLRPLCGHDEALINGAGMVEAIGFLDRMLLETAGTCVGPGKAGELAICDCDRLFAAIYEYYFGKRIESTVTCKKCNQAYELSFSLPELVANLGNGTAEKATGPNEEGLYTLPDGRRFRLPTASDRNTIMALEPEKAVAALLECCVVEGDPTVDAEMIQTAMNDVGATLDLDLDTTCPECGTAHPVRFDIQSYLLRTLTNEKTFLNHEVHRLALAYGWGYKEILNLTREDRRAFARLIEADLSPVQRRRRA